MATNQQTIEQLNKIFAMMEDINLREQIAAEELNKLKIDNAKRLAALQIELLNKNANKELEIQKEIQQKYLDEGGKINTILAREKRRNEIQELEEWLAKELKEKGEAARAAIEAEYKEKRQKLDEEFEEKLKREKGLREELQKLDDEEAKEKRKREKKEELEKKKKKKQEAKDAFSTVQNELGTHITDIFRKGHIEAARDELAAKGIEGKDADKYIRAAQADAVYKALAGFAKQLENTATDVAKTQEMVDTRLWGSNHKKSLSGSYWQERSYTITKNIAMSPFIKQADAVNNLKNLVSKGIAYNVEQRAFLDTISEKIATTFEATDASLVKLVRIQQADSTAARLGMEAALNEFLNNMYETTEYMQGIAEQVRGSIYEASALMTAEEATEFEYQVQKWIGSLYSVGFNNTQGLAGALGKLAAGDISGITDGGYGNLLVMAANQAGDLSIAEILQNGLDNDETNRLMQAMVEYLANIYEETKTNKVVAQQFANVYGLTASDLKAAANLAQSTQKIYKNDGFSSYEQMLNKLTSMADSVWERTAPGTMITNIFENLKYSTAATIGNDPVLYSTYMIASMLDDTVGGIAIPSVGSWVMGNGVEIDLETTVADIMRTGAMAGGLIGGIGKMLFGLGSGSAVGFSGSGMLKAFGVNTDDISTVNRGKGPGVGTTDSGTTISNSGYVGNSNADDIINSTVGGEQEKARQKAGALQEEQREIGLANVDEHIVEIHNLLREVVNGTYKFHIANDSVESWTSNYAPSGVPLSNL